LAPVLDELASDYADRVKVAEIDVDRNNVTALQYGIRGVPALFFYKNGKLADQVSGALPKADIEKRLQVLLK
jgi:thioredoxin-like negative regulator of GroEL